MKNLLHVLVKKGESLCLSLHAVSDEKALNNTYVLFANNPGYLLGLP